MRVLEEFIAAISVAKVEAGITSEDVEDLRRILSHLYALPMIELVASTWLETPHDGRLSRSVMAQIVALSRNSLERELLRQRGIRISASDLSALNSIGEFWIGAIEKPIGRHTVVERALKQQRCYNSLTRYEQEYGLPQAPYGGSSIAHACFWFIRDSIAVGASV